MLNRRVFLTSIALSALPITSGVARAQTYPARPVRLIVGFTPGSAPDIVARLLGQWLSERLGQQFLIENRGGAGGNIGSEVVVRAPADGYTLLLVGAPNAINTTLYIVGDFVPGYEASAFWGVGAPRNTPAEIIDTLNKEINAGLSDPQLRRHLADGGGTMLAGSPADFGKVIGDETENWAKVIKFAGLRPE